VRKFRIAKNMSQQTLSNKLEMMAIYICRGSISRIEEKRRTVTDIELFGLAKVLGGFGILFSFIGRATAVPTVHAVPSHISRISNAPSRKPSAKLSKSDRRLMFNSASRNCWKHNVFYHGQPLL